jgi:ACS family hexuronate transporter-like MFS transporter
MAFVATGALGFLWLIFWLIFYRHPQNHPRISAAELAHIQSDAPDPITDVPWSALLPRKQTWAFALGKFLSDPVWWFYLFWLPKYLQEKFGLSLLQVVAPTLIVYNAASIGSIGGGWLSSALIQRGATVNFGRKIAMLLCALCMLPVLYAPFSTNLWLVVGLISLATSAHQGWSANLFTLVSDMFPRSAVGRVVGIGATAGALGGVLIQITTGYVVQLTHSYLPLFIFAGLAYIAALAIIHVLAPRLEPAELQRA